MQSGPWVNIDDLGTEAGACNGQSVQQHFVCLFVCSELIE